MKKIAFALFIASICFVGCKEKTASEKAADAVEQAQEDAGDAAADAEKNAGELLNK
jgi:outer membrane lipoprotein-sorting protein